MKAKMLTTALVLMTGAALSEPFTYVDHWPSGTGDETSTEVIVPDGTPAPIADATDVARVARLTKLAIGAGSTVSYTAASDLVLSASLSGAGTFQSANAGKLTISGDNSALVSPGHFYFTNSPVVVSHQAGLGARATGPAVCYFNTKSTLDFVCENGVFTNEAPLHVNSRPGSNKLRIGVSPRTGRLVQHNSFKHLLGSNSADNTVLVDGTLEFLDCDIAVTWKFLYFGASGGTSHLWFTGNCTYHESYATFMYDGNLKIHFNGTSNFGAGQVLTSNAFCEGPDVLKDAYIMPWQVSMILDLQGYDQKLLRFDNTYGNASQKRRIHSEKPAVLTTTGNTAITHSPMFTGAAGYCHANTATETIQNYVSTSTNLLEVAKGKVVLTANAGWSGDVTVRNGATLELSSAMAITGGDRRLVVEPTGKLVLKAGSVCTVASALLGETELSKGSFYTVAEMRDKMELPVDGDDSALLTVSGQIEWKGWPESGSAVVPSDMTVYIGDTDIVRVSGLDAIKLMPGLTVVCTNWATPFILTTPLSGTGRIVATDVAPLVLNADNSLLQSPGTFSFANTDVIVSNRYGLGSVGTAMVTFNRGAGNHNLRFGGEGLVCDAPIEYASTLTGNNGNIGPDLPGETLIFSNSFRIVGTHPTFYFKNNVRFSGGTFGTYGNNHIYSNKAAASAITPQVWFDENVKVHVYFWFASDCVYHIGWKAVDWVDRLTAYTGGAKIICERKDSLGLVGAIGANNGANNYYDLNGYDQGIKNMTTDYYAGNGLVVTSGVPAVLSVKNKATDAKFLNTPARFRGVAGYTQAAATTNAFYGFYSDTLGPLTVEKGGLRLRDGAGWGGTNVTVKANAALIVAATSATNAFNAVGEASQANLNVEAGGKIRLESTVRPVRVRTYVYGGKTVRAGSYTSADNVGIDGPGTLQVRRTFGKHGFVIIFR